MRRSPPATVSCEHSLRKPGRRGRLGSSSRGMLIIVESSPTRVLGSYEGTSQPCKQAHRIRARSISRSRACGSRSSLGSPWAARTRLPGVEGQLEVVHTPQLVVHGQQGLDDTLDVSGHAVDLLVRDPLQLALKLLVQRKEPGQTTGRREATIDLLIRGDHAVENLTDTVRRDVDGGVHRYDLGILAGMQFGCHQNG